MLWECHRNWCCVIALSYIHHTYLTHRSISQWANLVMNLLLLSPKNVSLNIFCSVARIYFTKTVKERAFRLSSIVCVYLVFIWLDSIMATHYSNVYTHLASKQYQKWLGCVPWVSAVQANVGFGKGIWLDLPFLPGETVSTSQIYDMYNS